MTKRELLSRPYTSFLLCCWFRCYNLCRFDTILNNGFQILINRLFIIFFSYFMNPFQWFIFPLSQIQLPPWALQYLLAYILIINLLHWTSFFSQCLPYADNSRIQWHQHHLQQLPLYDARHLYIFLEWSSFLNTLSFQITSKSSLDEITWQLWMRH